MCIGAFGTIAEFSHRYSDIIPTQGGSLSVGIVGVPRYINPVLATTDSDRALSELVYGSLLKRTGSTSYEPNLAESYTISPDGLTYTFMLRKGLRFHDGRPLDSVDVKATIDAIQSVNIRSPWALMWAGVRVETPDAQTVLFHLEKPYSGFLYATTVGIIPEHIFGKLTPSEFLTTPYNVHPIGSGAYKVTDVSTKRDIITGYDLKRFSKGSYPTASISRINVTMYQNQDDLIKALSNEEVDTAYNYDLDGKDLKRIPKKLEEIKVIEPRLFSLFLNPVHGKVLGDTAVRNTIIQSINRNSITEQVLEGRAHPEYDIIPDALEANPRTTTTTQKGETELNQILDKSGWKVNTATGIREKGSGPSKQTLSLTLATVDTEDLVKTAHQISDTLKPLGIDITVAVYQLGDLDRDIIRPRSYDILLFGQVLKQPTDLYAFWHSSQRKDPGLNISEYADRQSDLILESMIKKGIDEASLHTLSDRVLSSGQVIPLYSPISEILVPKNINRVAIPPLANQSDWLSLMHYWYRYTDRVFTFFH
jgi:peptide/nickel transport system substrate-binding protein